MNVTLYPTKYSKDNSRLHAILFNKFKGKRTPILYGYFSFVKEQFYISNTAPGVRLTYEIRTELIKELRRFHWNYSYNMDAKAYRDWLKYHSVFNY